MTEDAFAGMVDRALTRPDGRVVAWTEWGDPEGRLLLRVPGTPGCRWSVRADRTPWSERGLRVVTTERPGFGRSTRLPGRGFLEHADDLAAVLDHLAVDSTPVLGGSGAAPHILALAAQHPDRVLAATVVSGAAPLEPEEWDEMVPLNARFHHLLAAGDLDGIRTMLAEARESILADPLGGMGGILATAPPEDLAVMADPGWRAVAQRALREALEPSVGGWIEESLALDQRWDDLDLSAIRASVTWWHSVTDRNAPLSAARRLVARLPTAHLVEWADPGHFAAYRKEGDILDELLARC